LCEILNLSPIYNRYYSTFRLLWLKVPPEPHARRATRPSHSASSPRREKTIPTGLRRFRLECPSPPVARLCRPIRVFWAFVFFCQVVEKPPHRESPPPPPTRPGVAGANGQTLAEQAKSGLPRFPQRVVHEQARFLTKRETPQGPGLSREGLKNRFGSPARGFAPFGGWTGSSSPFFGSKNAIMLHPGRFSPPHSLGTQGWPSVSAAYLLQLGRLTYGFYTPIRRLGFRDAVVHVDRPLKFSASAKPAVPAGGNPP